MRWKSALTTVLGYAVLIGLTGSCVAAFAQSRPENGPFDAAKMTMPTTTPGSTALAVGRMSPSVRRIAISTPVTTTIFGTVGGNLEGDQPRGGRDGGHAR